MSLKSTYTTGTLRRCSVTVINLLLRMNHIFHLLIFIPAVLPLSAATLTVCKKGCTRSTITEAVEDARKGDLIVVEEGIYYTGIVKIMKPLSIKGRGEVIIDGRNRKHVLYIRADNVSIENLTIRNSGMSYVSDYAGIRAEHVSNCQFKNNIISENTYGIYLEKVDGCIIRNNVIHSSAAGEVQSGNGIHLFYSQNITATGNDISGHRDGLYFEYTENSVIKDNISHRNLRFGMHFMFSHYNSFSNNYFYRNQTGVAIMYSRQLVVERNIFAHSTGSASYGFLIKEITDSEFQGNLFYRNTMAVTMNASNRNVFQYNSFYLNGWAVEIYSNSYNNRFRENNFINNHFQIATNSTRNTNLFEKNYYSDNRDYDLNHDNIADRPHKLVSVFGYWVVKFPALSVLLNSPAVNALEMAEKAFPVITSATLKDNRPLMTPIRFKEHSQIIKRLKNDTSSL